MSALSNLESDTMCHNTLSTVISEAPSNSKWVKPHSQLIRTVESGQSGQGIDVTLQPGVTNARFIQNLMTPSGLKPVILLTDSNLELDTRQDYLPSVPLPEQGHNWSQRFESIAVSGSPTVSASPIFSQRTSYYMKPFQFYSSHVLVRLVCKPGATQAQNFWVSRSFQQLDFSTPQYLNEIGFNWNPSKSNEIFVLMPYSFLQYVASIEEDTANIFGFINVSKTSSLVTVTGNDIPLVVNYYFCPFNMYTYKPLPILTPILKYNNSLDINMPSTTNGIQIGTFDLGTLNVYSDTIINLSNFGISSSATILIKISSVTYTISAIAVSYNSAVLFTPGNYLVQYTSNAITTRTSPFKLTCSTLGDFPTFTPFFAREQADFTSQKEIHSVVEVGEEQIFEFSYNPLSNVPSDTYGNMFSNSPREEHHERALSEISITSATKDQVFNFSLDLSFLTATYPNINTREYLRHFLTSRMPILTLRSAKNLFSNLILRLVVGNYSSTEDVMQLPGHEWDPSIEDKVVQPYWIFQDPATVNLVVDFSIIVISGQIDVSGFLLVPFFNTSALDYYHRQDYSPYDSSETKKIPPVTSIEDFVLQRVPEQAQCRQNVKPISAIRRTLGFLEIGNEQMGSDPETITESVEISKTLKEDSTTKVEGQTMETLPVPIVAESHKVMREKDFHVVGNIVENLTNLKSIIIPISHNAFGKEEVTSAKKYLRWKGLPRFRITVAVSSRLGGIALISQLPPTTTYKDLQVLNYSMMYNKAQTVYWNKSEEFQAVWMNSNPFQKVSYSESDTDLPVPQLGYFVISFPTPIDSSGLDDGNVKIVVECNTSNIVYDRPSYSYPTWKYPGLRYTTVSNT